MITKNELKLHCPKCKKIRNFDVNKNIVVNSSIDKAENRSSFYVDNDVNYTISITCSYCNHEIYHEEDNEFVSNLVQMEKNDE